MKKITLFVCLLASGISVEAQYVKQPFALKDNGATHSRTIAGNPADVKIAAGKFSNLAKTTGAVITTDNLGTGTNTTLPTGWKASSGASWKWRNVACASTYNIGVINSTTAANGWLVYDSDSIAALSNATALDAWVVKKWTIASGHSHVGMIFQEWFRSFYDDCYVEVSTDSVNWTQYPVSINNSLPATNSLPTNPYTVSVNFSSLPTGQTSFYTRFRYTFSGPAGGGYNWLVDDISLVDVDSVDVNLRNSFVYGGWGEYGSSAFNALPLSLADSLAPVTLVSNKGFTGLSSISITANIYKGATNVYTKTITRPLVLGAADSIFQFPGYKPTTTGDYVVAFSSTVTGDANTVDNKDTVKFTISDTVYSQNQGTASTSFYVHRPSSLGESAAVVGTRFDIPANETVNMTGVSVAFASTTTVGSKIGFQVYEVGTNGWEPINLSKTITLTAADISTSSAIVYKYIPIDPSVVGSSFSLTGSSSYVVIIAGDAVPASSTVAVLATVAPNATGYSGYFGQGDSATNSMSNLDFGAGSFATGYSNVPLIRLHLAGTPIFPSAVKDVNAGNIVVNAYPNPATNTLNISYNLESAATVNVKLVNTIGQVVDSKSSSYGAKGIVSLNVATLPAGVYLYTVEANGSTTTERVVVTH